MNYEELMEFALAHYEKGGDFVYECWDRKIFNEYVAEFGAISKEKALAMFEEMEEHRREIQATIW